MNSENISSILIIKQGQEKTACSKGKRKEECKAQFKERRKGRATWETGQIEST